MKNKKAYNYGNCHTCGERMEEHLIKQDFWIKRKLIVLDGVPAGVCRRCGERVVSAEVGLAVAALLQKPRSRKARTISVPVIRFEKVA